MRREILLITALLIVISAPGARSDSGDQITVTYDDGRSPETMVAEKAEKGSEELYLRANDVAKIFRATQFWNASSRKVVLGIEDTRFVLTVDTRVVLINDQLIMLRNPVRYQAGFVLIPMEFVVDIASHHAPLSFSWDRASMVLGVKGKGYNVESLSISITANRSTAVIQMSEPLVYHLDANTPGLVRLKIYGGRVDPKRFLVKEQRGLFNGARAEQTERDAYIYFDIQKYASRVHVEKEDNPPRLMLVLEKGELPEIPEPDFAGRKAVEVPGESEAPRRHLEVEKIVIDPGHGGKDYGKVGVTGVLEKDVNLQLAEVTANVLRRKLGVEVILTRTDDRLMSLTRRTEIANEAGADLFISVHCNGWFSSEINGFEAYFLSPAKTEWDKSVAQVENESARFSDENGKVSSDISFILWDMVQNEYISESSYLAELIQKAISEKLEISNRGVKQANFTVLQGAKMPAVLLETAFLSNPKEEQLLQDSGFQNRVAEAICEAVQKFKSRYESSTSD
jgi:N-acetylmuramoyl-L-alanine amidase